MREFNLMLSVFALILCVVLLWLASSVEPRFFVTETPTAIEVQLNGLFLFPLAIGMLCLGIVIAELIDFFASTISKLIEEQRKREK